MFTKIDVQFVADGWSKLNKQVDFGKIVDGKFMGIAYYNLDFPNASQFYELIPEKFRKDFYLSLLWITDSIPAHTDSHDRAVINFYIQPDDCITKFFRIAHKNPTTSQIKNMTDGHLFDEDQLSEVGRFTALTNDVYLLDTKSIHSVQSTKKHVERLAIQLGTGQYSYQQVKEMIDVV